MSDLVHDECRIVDSELDQTLFRLFDSLKELVLLDQGSTFDIWHQAFRTKNPSKLL